MPCRNYAILGSLMFALVTPAVAGTPAQWFKIMYQRSLRRTAGRASSPRTGGRDR